MTKADIWLRRFFITALKSLRVGELTLITPEKETWHFIGKEKAEVADLKINDWGVIKNLMIKGDIGFAEDYIAGKWESENLASLLIIVAKNKVALERFFQREWLKKRLNSFRDWQNIKAQAAPMICVQEEVGKDFYQIMLDSSMTYSAAIYDGTNQPLEKAQAAKYGRILGKISGAKHVLEIGCGWGGFIEAATKQGHDVRGITLSPEQVQFCNERVKKDVALAQDYRTEAGQYDAVVSIEMMQALSKSEWPDYLSAIKKALKPAGKAVIQTIIATQEDLQKNVFFERQKKTFPSHGQFVAEAENAGLRVTSTYKFGQDYAKTISVWLKNIESQLNVLRELCYSEEIIRSWRFYLAYCYGHFITHNLDVMQVEISN